MDKVTRKLTIFEGPDGSGKSTAAAKFAEATGAKLVHFGPLPRVSAGLARMYAEGMLPALLGYQDVVFDRCWLSEAPYGTVFREGYDRLGDSSRRMLERLALRCGAVVVRCDPGWDAVRESYMRRKHLEMLDNDTQLHQVYELYQSGPTDLPEVRFDYTVGFGTLNHDSVEAARTPLHPLGISSAGAWDANVVLVGESYGERKDTDPLYQWPFASFSRAGCSQWLAHQLDVAEVSERDLLWVNANQDLDFLLDLQPGKIVALGNEAVSKLYKLKLQAATVPHPQSWKRFYHKQRYPLINLLQEVL